MSTKTCYWTTKKRKRGFDAKIFTTELISIDKSAVMDTIHTKTGFFLKLKIKVQNTAESLRQVFT
jgi:hypothetical protein